MGGYIETGKKREDNMDGSTGMNVAAAKIADNWTKTVEQMASFGQENVGAIMKSGRVWAAGCQDISKTMAATAQAHLDQTTSTWKALTSAKSLREAMDLQAAITRTSFQTAFAETGKLTESTVRLAEQTIAPIMKHFTLTIEKFTRPAD
jgi:phasin family protein